MTEALSRWQSQPKRRRRHASALATSPVFPRADSPQEQAARAALTKILFVCGGGESGRNAVAAFLEVAGRVGVAALQQQLGSIR